MRSLVILGAILFPICAFGQSFEFKVKHRHAIGGCHGSLRIGADRIEYKADKGEHSRSWPYEEIQHIKVESSARLEIKSYEDQKLLLGRDRSFNFELIEGRISSEVVAFLVAKSVRPVIASIFSRGETDPKFQAPVKHLHRFGGCHGVLRIYADRVTYESETKPEHSRQWRYSDIRHFGYIESYRLEIAGVGEYAFNFQLKVELPERARDYVWARVHPSGLYPRDEVLEVSSVWQPEPQLQTARVVLGRGGYEPSSLTFKLGVPVRIEFMRQIEGTCGTQIVIPEYGIRRELPLGEPVIVEFTPGRSGQFTFSCGMGMLRGTIIVQ
jgi:hypothetical protein